MHKTFEYREGYQAYLDGESPSTCPYEDDSDDYEDWQEGYQDAIDDEDID